MPNKVDPVWFREKRTKMISDDYKAKGWTHQVILAVIDEEEANSYFFLSNEEGKLHFAMHSSTPDRWYSNHEQQRMSQQDIRDYYKCLMRALKFYKEDYTKTVVE